MLDDITQAVLAREDVAQYLRGGHGQTELEARERIQGYLDELRTTQRYPIYRALKHPLYPILRKIERIDEGVEIAGAAAAHGRTIYISNHKSHLDYLVEPLVLDDNGVRPPVIAAGINLFGGPLGLLHRHVTGAIPIRRNTKDPAYLVTLKAYVAELLQRHDLMFYIEGGRSYSGEMKAPKTGLLHAAMQSGRTDVVDPADGHRLRPGARGSRARAPGREAAAAAVRPRNRGDGPLRRRLPVARVRHLRQADPADRLDRRHTARRDGSREAGARHHRRGCTRCCRPRCSPRRCGRRSRSAISSSAPRKSSASSAPRGANLGVRSGREAVETGTPPLADRGIIHVERGGRFRVRERTVLRYYARTLQHLLTGPGARPVRTDVRSALEGVLHASPAADTLKSLASRYGMRRPDSFARRFIAGETRRGSDRRRPRASKRPA